MPVDAYGTEKGPEWGTGKITYHKDTFIYKNILIIVAVLSPGSSSNHSSVSL